MKTFETVLKLMECNYGKNKIIEGKGKFYFASDSDKNELVIPKHYRCNSCGIIEGEPRYSPGFSVPSDVIFSSTYNCNKCGKEIYSTPKDI